MFVSICMAKLSAPVLSSKLMQNGHPRPLKLLVRWQSRILSVMKKQWFALATILALSCSERTATAAPPVFRHHFIARDLPITTQGVGDYGLTALVDLDRDGDLDFVLGGRSAKPSQLYWFE